MKNINFLYWFNIVLSIVVALFGNWTQATVLLCIATVYYAAELIIKEIHKIGVKE